MKRKYYLLGIAFFIGIFFIAIVQDLSGVVGISKVSLNDACKNITGNENAEGSSGVNNKLVCTIPSIDHSNNIIIKKAGED